MPTSRIRKLLSTLFFFVSLCVSAQAETYYWIGGAPDNNWSTLANWNTTLDGSGSTPAAAPGAGDNVYFPKKATTVNLDSDITVTEIQIPNPNLEIESFSVELTGSHSITVTSKIETVRAAKQDDEGNYISKPDATSTLIFNCDVTSPSLIMHSGGNITLGEGKTASITDIVNTGNGTTPDTMLTVNGSLTSNSIQMSTVTTRLLTVSSTGSITANSITGSAGSVTNNGLIVTQTAVASDLVAAGGSGTTVTPAAGEIIWTGAVSTAWDTAGNWFSNSVPSSSATIKIPSSAPKKPVITTNVTIDNAANLNVENGANITVNGSGSLTPTTGTFDISKINNNSTGTLIFSDDYSHSSDDYSAPNLAIECGGNLTVSKNLQCKSINITGTSTLTNASLTATGDDGIRFGGAVTVNTSATLGGNVSSTSAVNINIESGNLSHTEVSSNKNWSTNLTTVLKNDGCTFDMLEGISYKTKVDATSGDVYFVGNGTISSLNDSGAGCNIHFGNADSTQNNTLTFSSNIAFSTSGKIIFDESCSGLSGSVTLSGINKIENKSTKLTNTLGVNFSLNSGAEISGASATAHAIKFNNLTFDGTATVGVNIENSGTLNASGAVTFNKDYTNKGTATFNDDVSVAGNVTDNGTWNSAYGKKLIFNGTGDQFFTPKASTTYKLIEVNKSTGSFSTDSNNNLNVTNFTLTDCPATTFNDISTFATFNSNSTSGNITFANDATIKYDTTFNTSGTVSFSNSKTFAFDDGASVTHTAGPTNITGTLTAATVSLGTTNISGSISASSANFEATTITGDTTITTEAGDTINFNGQVTGSASLSTETGSAIFANTVSGLSNLTTAATATFNGNVNIGSLSAQNAKINCDSITTTGTQIYTGAVTLEKNVELKTTNNTNGNIFFDTIASTINSKAGENHSLSINIPAGRTVTCGGEIGKTNHLSSITIIQSGNATFNKEIVTNAFEITQADSIEFKGAVTASTFNITKATSTTFDEAVTIGTFTDATTHTGTITFKKGGEITNTSGTTFNTSGTVTFGNASTDTMTFGTTSPLAYANLTHEKGDTNITGTLKAAEIKLGTTSGTTKITSGVITGTKLEAGNIETSGSIMTSGEQKFTGTFKLSGDTALTSTSDGDISFTSTITGSKKLTLTAPFTKAITVTGAVGDNTTAPSIKIMQAGSTSFAGRVKLTSFEDATGHTGAVSFTSGGRITNAVTFNTSGKVSITGPMTIGTTSPYANLIHDAGNTNISGTLTAAEIKLGTSSGTTTITSGVINGAKFEAGTLKAAGNITTSGEQHYKGTVELTDALNLKSNTSSITFDQAISGAKALSTNSSTGTSFDGDVGSSTTKLTSLIVTGPAAIGCSNVYTSEVQSFEGAVTLAVDTALTAGGNISFGSTINGNHSITLNCPYNTTNTITVTGAVGSDATSTDDAPSITITQAGNVSFTQAVKAKAFAITKANSTTFSKAVTIKTFTDDVLDKTDNGTITFKNGGSITDAVTFNTTSDITLTGTLETSSIQMNNLVIDGTSKIQTTGTQIYNGTINGKVTSPDSDDILELNSGTGSINFGGNLGQTTKLKKLTVTGPAQINTDLTFTVDAISFNTSLTSTTTPASTLTLSNCTSLTNPTAAATVTNIDFIFTGTSGNTTTFTPGNSEYENITNNTITLKLENNAFKQNQNASFTINSGSVEKGSGGFNAGKLIIAGGSFTQSGIANDSVYDMELTDGSLTWDAGAAGGNLEIKGTVTEGAGLHINYNKKNIALSQNNTISGVFWSLTIADGITITNGGSIRIRKDFIINGQYIHNDNTTILGLDMTTNPPANDSTENGEVSNTNATPSNLGKVYINKSTSYSQTAASNLKFTDLEVSSGTFTVPVGKIIESNNFINNENCSNSGTISITKDFTDAGTYTGTGLLNFTGSGAQIFAPGSSTYTNIENTYANPLTVSRDLKTENFTIASGRTSTFAGKTQISNMTISSALETIFTDTVNITNFDDNGHNGKLNFKNSGSIANATEFHTSDSITIGDNAEDQMIFGTNSAKVDFTHTAGPTIITGKLKAKNITLGDTTTALTKIASGTVNAESLTAGTLEAEGTITTSGLQKYEGSIKLTNDLILKSDNSTITFDSTITGANAFSAESKNGTSFGGDVGNTAEKLTSLTVTGPASIGSSNIFTSGSQSFSGAVTITTTPSSHTLNAGTISFDASSTIDGDSDLVLVTSAGTSFGAKVGSTTSLSSLDVRGNTTIACSEIKTTENQNYHSPVILSTSTAITSAAGNLTFDSTIDGNKTLTLSVPDTTLPPAAKNSITVSGKVGASTESGITNPPSIIIAKAGDVSFDDTVKAENFTITKAINTNFDGAVLLSTFTDTANAGDISFKNGGRISNTAGTIFSTNGLVTFGDNSSDDIMTFGSSSSLANLKHTAGNTSITGILNAADVAFADTSFEGIMNAANITLGQTDGGPMTINNSGLFTTTDSSALTYTTSFIQTGAGNTKLGGSFTGNGNASFAKNLQIYGSSQADFGAAGTTINIGGNLIVVLEAIDELDILSNLSVAESLVLYKGAVSASADISAGNDILILGEHYSTTDTSTGISDEYSYTTPRHSDWSQPNYTEANLPDGTDIPTADFSATLSVSEGSTISVGKNFYTNGTTLSLNGTSGQWNLKLPDLTNPANGFAEAYHSVVSGCKVICNDENDGSEVGTQARLVTLECTDSGDGTPTPNTNVEFEDFQITKAYTVRDNVIRVEFNQPIRYHSSTISSLKFHNASDAVASTTNFTGFYSDPDCQHELTSDITQFYTDEANGKTYWYFYIKAAPQDSASTGAWNTDATGKSSGTANGKSSDRYGIHHTTLPCLDFPRALADSSSNTSLSFIITDRWGKRLNNYSRRVPKGTDAEPAYGSQNSSNEVADKTGPVLWTVRTGQELHDTYQAGSGATSQHSYDSHNFLEFRYSEPVDFYENNSLRTITENFRVTDSLGAIQENISQSHSSLTFAGLAKLNAPTGSPLKLYTGSQGNASKYVNALYRLDEYSIRLSIAGFTDGTVSDYAGNVYKKWPGYIEEASQFTGANALACTTTGKNNSVKDLAGNCQEEYASGTRTEPEVLSSSEGNYTPGLLPVSPDLYSAWDLSSPVITPLRFSKTTEWGNQEMSEAIGNTNGSGSTLDRIDFHFFDNTPTYSPADTAEWYTEIGWCNPNSEAAKENLKDSSYTYCADIIGGARQFAETSRRTSGGIRFSTKVNISPAFKYSTNPNNTSPDSSFKNDLANLHTTIVSQLFTGSSEPMRPANDPDGLYLGLGITDNSLSVETTFAFSYNETQGYLTDLAGNRLRTFTSRTIDRTPPSFDVVLSPIDTKSVYIIFVKELETDTKNLTLRNNNGTEEIINEKFETLIPKCFQLISIDDGGNALPNSATEIQIDTSVPAQIIKNNSNSSFTCIKLTTTEEISIDNIKNLYIQLIMPEEYPSTSIDPYTSNQNSRVTLIRDTNRNYMTMYSAHALSDFAINYVNPLYAYSSDILDSEESVMNGLYENGSWAVHDWNANQNNYGTLPAEHPVSIVADTKNNQNIRIYLSPAPDSESVSKQFNKDFNVNLRVWLPELTDSIFRALTSNNNTNYVYTDGREIEDSPENLIFALENETVSAWKPGNQISFMFGLMENETSPVRIHNNPYYDVESGKFNLNLSIPVPLFCLRMPDTSNINSLDLWSFKLKNIKSQRGGVTILNNVIDAGKGEKTVVKVDMPEDGRLNVAVMTLDGNIITYLHRGNAKAGENYFTWDGKNRSGSLVARGMYFIRVFGGDFDETRKVMVVK